MNYKQTNSATEACPAAALRERYVSLCEEYERLCDAPDCSSEDADRAWDGVGDTLYSLDMQASEVVATSVAGALYQLDVLMDRVGIITDDEVACRGGTPEQQRAYREIDRLVMSIAGALAKRSVKVASPTAHMARAESAVLRPRIWVR